MKTTFIALAIITSGSAMAFNPGQTNWFVGIDTLTALSSGPYAGRVNPNLGRLTILYGHMYPELGSPTNWNSNHYHAKSSLRYYRETAGGTILTSDTAITVNPQGVATGFVNFLPETAGARIRLLQGTGVFAGKYVTGKTDNTVEWENMGFRPTAWLNRAGADFGEKLLFNSSGGRFAGGLGSARIGLEIVSLSAGIEAFDASGLQYTAGQIIELGSGSFNSAPVFATATANLAGSAKVRLVDMNGGFMSSGWSEYRLEAVPEPGTMAVLAIGALALARRRKKK